jgi:G:T/U-mismatch repair DNA glycosylase
MGIWPTARKNHAVFHESKYSALATKVTRRRTTRGMNNESQKATWFGARITGPRCGMWSIPSTSIRHRSRKMGMSRDFTTQ